MILLETPSVTDGVQVWRRWLSDLNKIDTKLEKDDSIKSAKARALRVITIFEKYPNGLTASSPDFKKIVKELSK